jgi:seryl-tRNA synthetase
MTVDTAADTRLATLRELGLDWREAGQVSLRGPLGALAQDIDQAFVRLATAVWGAEPEWHPASLPAERLQRVDYLHSFPHQATFPLRLDPDEANLDAFRAGPMVQPDGTLALTRLAPAREVLTPAACHHLYTAHEGDALSAPLYLTTRNTCFRHEAEYVPLRRQWSFSMREIVCLGTAVEAAAFLEQARFVADALLRQAGLPVKWESATDPFFRPTQNPKYLIQRVQPIKHEAVYGGDLAIGSVNLHHEHFGEAFSITRDGAPAHSACIAFGIERWLYAVTDGYGTDPASWPDFTAAADHAAASIPAELS